MALGVRKDAELGDFFREPLGVGLGVSGGDAEENEEARADVTDDGTGDGDAGCADSLDDGAHELSEGGCRHRARASASDAPTAWRHGRRPATAGYSIGTWGSVSAS